MVCGCKGMDYLQNKRYTFLLKKMDNIIIIIWIKEKIIVILLQKLILYYAKTERRI